ncbi:23S rRNA (pseudouridine(1915)-N(3))-methyltransferase RlmH [Varunaivibrio sulfuroxidans]|uniref:Ribosomal RNA large subunit methyltransferase H n=1 Tax=Varunaivibrio sulfuroxidans TaxID=1773489 RepID=A0A4R3J696_9PROT|nr:23S rRNA (pseudouridine(1915)-N(3))-methyltransferase RlmH [Varunaivibrio sulfuroxidans]TCS60872.1 23S rRNA (pseudouridine1915-N3)-methyltransferase [Varunaivibrio sulfuroxidans]WES31717.1 23S rRNA (pseudouridine(1915)-N(3))-methyltransferase RlmH [Varunaivibrio sulfuroxidans]
MQVHLIAVGRAKAGAQRALFEHFNARISPSIRLREVEEKRPLAAAELMRREALLLLQAAPVGAYLIALDERGKTLSSPSFAERLGELVDGGRRDIAFIIGGAHGLDESVRRAAGLCLSFGAQTWPHMLVRGLLAEQVYRAQCILSGHPYHRA